MIAPNPICPGCPHPSECAPHGCAKLRPGLPGLGGIVYGPPLNPGNPMDDAMAKLRKALDAGQVKPVEPAPAAELPAITIIPTGWQCPCCETVMAPHMPTCVNCTGKK